MKFCKILTAGVLAMSAIVISGCSSDTADEPVQQPESADSEKSGDEMVLDERFPFEVWSDADGNLHMGSSVFDSFPSEEEVMGTIVGHGWELDKSYVQVIVFSGDPDDEGHLELKIDSCDLMWYGDCSTKWRYYFGSESSASVYCLGIDFLETDENGLPIELYGKYEERFSYDSGTGVLKLHILREHQLVNIGEKDLWFASLVYGKIDSEFQILHFVRVDPDTVDAWNDLYCD